MSRTFVLPPVLHFRICKQDTVPCKHPKLSEGRLQQCPQRYLDPSKHNRCRPTALTDAPINKVRPPPLQRGAELIGKALSIGLSVIEAPNRDHHIRTLIKPHLSGHAPNCIGPRYPSPSHLFLLPPLPPSLSTGLPPRAGEGIPPPCVKRILTQAGTGICGWDVGLPSWVLGPRYYATSSAPKLNTMVSTVPAHPEIWQHVGITRNARTIIKARPMRCNGWKRLNAERVLDWSQGVSHHKLHHGWHIKSSRIHHHSANCVSPSAKMAAWRSWTRRNGC